MASPRISSKLFKLKEWLTVPEAAKYLTTIFGEEVTEADVLRLSLDRHLKLSVYFVNRANAIYVGKFLPFAEWEQNFKNSCSWENFEPIAGYEETLGFHLPGYDFVFFPENAPVVSDIDRWQKKKLDEMKSEYLTSISLDQLTSTLAALIEHAIRDFKNKSKRFGGKIPPSSKPEGNEVLSIYGVWNLPLLSNEAIDIEHKYQQLTGGPEVTLMNLDGTLVESQDGELWQLQERFNHEVPQKQSSNTESSVKGHLKERPEIASRDPRNYYPAGALPEDSVLVVRTSALLDMQERLTEKKPTGAPKASPRAEITNLHIIGAMLQIIMDKGEFSSEEALRKHIAKEYAGFYGCAERTMAGRFSDAKKLLSEI